MSEAVVDDIVAVLPPLLQSLEALSFIARHLNPPDFGQVMEAAGAPDQALRAVRARLTEWPEQFSDVRVPLERASQAVLAAFEGLRAVQHGNGDLVSVFRALRHAPRAQEALYPLAARLPPVSQFFVDPPLREDAALLARLAEPSRENTGIVHDHNEPGSRGGFSLYVPEYCTPERAWPLVMALHGGSGHGRGFLWSWLRDARSFGAILVAPTATGGASLKRVRRSRTNPASSARTRNRAHRSHTITRPCETRGRRCRPGQFAPRQAGPSRRRFPASIPGCRRSRGERGGRSAWCRAC